jgi:hypothetical protein
LSVKIRSPREAAFKPFGTIPIDLSQFASTAGPQEISLGVKDCIVAAAIVSLTVTYVSSPWDSSSLSQRDLGSEPSPSARDSTIDHQEAGTPLPTTNSPQEMNTPVMMERRLSMKRRASLRAQAQGSFHSIDEIEDEEDRANRAAKELVERTQKQNEEYKKTNLALKSQLELLTDQLIEVNIQRAELLTNIDREILEKRRLRDRLQWYEWGSDLLGYLDLSPLWSRPLEPAVPTTPQPDPEELKDTE